MSIHNSPKVAIGPTLPHGNFENGTMFLKMDGVSNGLYVCFNSSWLLVGKILATEQMRFEPPLTAEPVSLEVNKQNITFGGNF